VMGSVQAAMASPAESLVVSDFMMADEMEDFVGHFGKRWPRSASSLLASSQHGSLALPIEWEWLQEIINLQR
jgi:hypothetical protein